MIEFADPGLRGSGCPLIVVPADPADSKSSGYQSSHEAYPHVLDPSHNLQLRFTGLFARSESSRQPKLRCNPVDAVG
jgi:hypothetical protein